MKLSFPTRPKTKLSPSRRVPTLLYTLLGTPFQTFISISRGLFYKPSWIDSMVESIRVHIVKWIPLAHVGSPMHQAVGSTERASDFLLCSHSSLRNNCSNMSQAMFLNLSARFQVFDFLAHFLFGVFPLPLSRDFSTHSLALTFALFLEFDSGSHQLLLSAVLINILSYRIGFEPCNLNDKYSSLEPCLTLEILKYSSPSQLTGAIILMSPQVSSSIHALNTL